MKREYIKFVVWISLYLIEKNNHKEEKKTSLEKKI